MTTVTARGPSAALLTRRSEELEREIERLRTEQRSIASRLREVRPRRHGVWMPALAGALVSATLAAPVVFFVVRGPPSPRPSVAFAATPVAAPETSAPLTANAPLEASASTASTPVPEGPRSEPAPLVRTPTSNLPTTREARVSSAKGLLTVVCLPRCEGVLLDGRSLGPGHLFGVPAPSGRHVLTLSAGSVKKILPVDIPPDATRDVRVDMWDDLPDVSASRW